MTLEVLYHKIRTIIPNTRGLLMRKHNPIKASDVQKTLFIYYIKLIYRTQGSLNDYP